LRENELLRRLAGAPFRSSATPLFTRTHELFVAVGCSDFNRLRQRK
jgi:hypothetical protein